MTETTDREALLALLEPFPAEQVGKLPRVTCPKCSDRRCDEHQKARCDVCGAYVSTRHIHLDYVGHADVTRRLLETDPKWRWEPLAFDDNGLPLFDTDDRGHPVGLWIRLTVLGVTRLGYGSCPSNQNDAVKVLIGDALRNAAMRFGAALDLWAKGDRADPAAENATAAGGQAARNRPQRRGPARTDHTWLTDIEKRIRAAASPQELVTLASEVEGHHRAGTCEDVHREHLWELGKRREAELAAQGPPRNKDGSISRSRMSDEELAAGGHMTREQVKEHNKLARDTVANPKKAERLATTPEDDPWMAPPAGGGDEA